MDFALRITRKSGAVALFSTLLLFSARATTVAAPAADPDSLPYHNFCPPDPQFKNKLVIHQLYVGQGDSAIIRAPSGLIVLIDGGESPNYAKVIKSTLQKCYGASTIDYIILTHPHSDHFGGLSSLINDVQANKTFTIKQFFTATLNMQQGENAPEFHAVISAAEAVIGASPGSIGKGIPLNDKTIVDPDGKVNFNVVVSNAVVAGKGSVADAYVNSTTVRDDNAVSAGMVISYGGFKFFTAGDITGGNTADGESHPDIESVVAEVVPRVDVYKASHHGSDTSNTSAILTALSPTVALVSVGAGGKNTSVFHLPRKAAISGMQNLPSMRDVLMTSAGDSADITPQEMKSYSKVKNLGPIDSSGVGSDIIVISDGSQYQVYGYHYKSQFTATSR